MFGAAIHIVVVVKVGQVETEIKSKSSIIESESNVQICIGSVCKFRFQIRGYKLNGVKFGYFINSRRKIIGIAFKEWLCRVRLTHQHL